MSGKGQESSSGIEMASGAGTVWCPGESTEPTFGDRRMAEALLDIRFLKDNGLTGDNVNVVIIDEGLNEDKLGASYADGWPAGGVEPGQAILRPQQAHGSHGMLVAANILKIAPDVRLFDLPMLPPPPIRNIPEFFEHRANAAFEHMLDDIERYRRAGTHPGPWVLVNAWAIHDRSTERNGEYTNNPGHPFNRLVDRAVEAKHDVIFAAGNCGGFCPNSRCGAGDRGPGRSILGANSHPKVLTVGAVRSDRIWLGYSSQGPGQPRLETRKPDLCAPSEFVENGDASVANTGTSTACALAAGVVAALRSCWTEQQVHPTALKAILNRTATPLGGGRNDRTGHGILNARKAFDALDQLHKARMAS